MHRLHGGPHNSGRYIEIRTHLDSVCEISVTMDMSLRDECLLQGSLFRLYYPCQETASTEKPDWIPSREYFNGLADFMKINRTLSERIFNYLFGISYHLISCLTFCEAFLYTNCLFYDVKENHVKSTTTL